MKFAMGSQKSDFPNKIYLVVKNRVENSWPQRGHIDRYGLRKLYNLFHNHIRCINISRFLYSFRYLFVKQWGATFGAPGEGTDGGGTLPLWGILGFSWVGASKRLTQGVGGLYDIMRNDIIE